MPRSFNNHFPETDHLTFTCYNLLSEHYTLTYHIRLDSTDTTIWYHICSRKQEHIVCKSSVNIILSHSYTTSADICIIITHILIRATQMSYQNIIFLLLT